MNWTGSVFFKLPACTLLTIEIVYFAVIIQRRKNWTIVTNVEVRKDLTGIIFSWCRNSSGKTERKLH